MAWIGDYMDQLTWLTTKEDRTPIVSLLSNSHYWNKDRKPLLKEVLFRNDLTQDQALHLCMHTEGEVDLVTEVSPNKASDIQRSKYAKLVKDKGRKLITGIFNRYHSIHHDHHFRLAINYAINREKLIKEGLNGYGRKIPALTPPWAVDFPEGLMPYEQNPSLALKHLRQSNWEESNTYKIAVFEDLHDIGNLVARQLHIILGINVKLEVIANEERLKWRHILAEKKLDPYFDLFIVDLNTLFLEGTPAFYHREVFGADGAYRIGPEIPEFNNLYNLFERETNSQKLLSTRKLLIVISTMKL